MGAAVEGWAHERIVATHGWLDRLLPYKHYTAYTDWQRPAGTTEDGIERQKLMNTTAIEKGGRFTAEDLVAVWVRDLQPARMVYKQEPFDQTLLEMARAEPARGGRDRALWLDEAEREIRTVLAQGVEPEQAGDLLRELEHLKP